MLETVIDTPVRTTPHLPFLRAQGIQTVIRYYNHRNSSSLPDKRLTPAEAQAICEHGMNLAVVFQQWGRDLDSFSAARGQSDAARALDCAEQVGQPVGSAIYFGVDHDFYRASEVRVIVEHFSAIKACLGGRYKTGAYASGALCERLKAEGLIDFVWLPRALGWAGSRQLHAEGRWDLFQNQVDIRLGELPVDTNIVNPAREGFGAFSVLEDSGLPADAGRQPDLYEVIARSGLRLRAGAGTQFDVLDSLPQGTVVDVLQNGPNPDWVLVSLEGDSTADGFLYKSYLAPLALRR